MVGFIDDTSGSINGYLLPEPRPLQHYITRATLDAQCRNNILVLSGRALPYVKCSYHYLYYSFTSSGLPILRGSCLEPVISMQFNNAMALTPLTVLLTHLSHKTLGVHKSPADNGTTAFRALCMKNTVHMNLVARCTLTPQEAWTYYHSIYLPRMCYSFPLSTMTQQQCLTLQNQIKKAILPKSGFNWNMHNSVIYSCSDLEE